MNTKIISFDYAIKYLLKNKANYSLVEGFLSALLKANGYSSVKILALLDTESNKEEYSQKKSIADLIVEDVNHTKYIIEIERQLVHNFVQKSCFNTSRLLVDQVSSGTDYTDIKKIFHISLLYFPVGIGPIYHGKTMVKEIETGEHLNIEVIDKITRKAYNVIDIFPEYIFISIPQFDDKLERELDEWLYAFKHEEIREDFKSPYMKQLSERLNILKMTSEERNEYFYYMKQVATQKNALDTALDKGKEEGRAEGKIEGKIEGKAEGKAEEKIKLAKNMLREGLTIDIVIKVTGLSEDVVKKLV